MSHVLPLMKGLPMSYSMNKVTVIGHVGQEPVIRTGTTGKRTASFSIATNEKWKTPDGQQQEKTEWHNIFVLAEHAATFVANYVSKGDHVVVEGMLQTKSYTDRDGQERKQTSIAVKQMTGSVGLLRTNQNSGNANNDEYEDLGNSDYPF